MKKIEVGDWVIYETYRCKTCQCNINFEVGEVLFINKHFVVVRHGGLAFDVANSIRFVGNRQQVFELQAKIDTMSEKRHEAIKAAEAKVTEIAGKHARAIRALII